MFEKLLEKLAIELDKQKIPYMVIGGQAVLAHGEPRLTRDIDLTIGWDTDRVGDLLKTVTNLGWKALPEKPADFAKETMVLPALDPESGIRIDFIFSFTPYEKTALERVMRIDIGHAKVCLASVEDLIIHKLIAGRPRDLEDVRQVLLKNPSIDDAYLQKWLVDFEESLARPLLSKLQDLKPHKKK